MVEKNVGPGPQLLGMVSGSGTCQNSCSLLNISVSHVSYRVVLT